MPLYAAFNVVSKALKDATEVSIIIKKTTVMFELFVKHRSLIGKHPVYINMASINTITFAGVPLLLFVFRKTANIFLFPKKNSSFLGNYSRTCRLYV